MTAHDLERKGFVLVGGEWWPRGSVCIQCGNPKSNRNAKFCSLACAYQNEERNRKPKKDRGTAVCEGCGVTFTLRTNGGVKYCCQKCASSTIGKRTLLQNRRRLPLVKVVCKQCGETFAARKSGNRVYCSMKCSGVAVPIKTAATNHARGKFRSITMYSRAKRGWRTIDGKRIWFRSRMEANYARYLTLIGKPWDYEPKTFWFEGIKRGVLSYTPDFFLPLENKYVETKGWMDDKSKTKLKRMKKYHPDVVVELVDYPSWKKTAKTVKALIPDWEAD